MHGESIDGTISTGPIRFKPHQSTNAEIGQTDIKMRNGVNRKLATSLLVNDPGSKWLVF